MFTKKDNLEYEKIDFLEKDINLFFRGKYDITSYLGY